MKNTTPFRRIAPLSLAAAFLIAAVPRRLPAAPPAPVEALLYSTMPSTAAHRPEMAMDGDLGTFFRSVYGMDDGDDFLILLSRPIPVRSLRVTTGDAAGENLLTNGYVETSPDTIHYSRAASFDGAGVAAAALYGAPVAALRIRLNPHQGLPSLLIREIALDSPVPITHVQQGPGRGFPDLSQTPDRTPALQVWAQKAERQMESFWPDTDALLYSDGFIPPNMVNVVYRTGPRVTGVAATGGGVMTVNTAWCDQHPDDTGLTVHETAHVVQAYSTYNPVWLVEGIADYIRWVKFEPQNFHPQINVQRSTYHDSYRTTATFLAWCEIHYDSALVTKLSRAIRFARYSNDLFKTYCGKDVDTLWSEFVAAYRADPANIITTPVAAADRPRSLPGVTAGTSTPVDLTAAFDTTGLFNDGTASPGAGGVDGEGFGYSAQLLGASQTPNGVTFRLGPAGAPDMVTAHGQVIPLPASSYASLWLLGTGVEGGQRAQTFTVTYTDGTTQVLSQNLSDWFQPQDFPGESRAVRMPYRDTASGARDTRPFYVYSYGFALDAAKTVRSLTLPTNEYVKVLAVTLAK
ncbi:MAG: hypothetical protein JO250_11265 [Armatimonadetes bacterium]|nr:hypothetical protein [Armatimonadota bacterium]